MMVQIYFIFTLYDEGLVKMAYMASQCFVKGSTYDHRSRQIVTTYVGLFDKQKTYIRGDWGELEQFTLKLL